MTAVGGGGPDGAAGLPFCLTSEVPNPSYEVGRRYGCWFVDVAAGAEVVGGGGPS
jgi:hypothetical protein